MSCSECMLAFYFQTWEQDVGFSMETLLVSLRTRIVSAEMLGGVFEGLGVPWKRPGGTLGASWAILEASWESC